MRRFVMALVCTPFIFAGVDQDWAALEALKGEWVGVGTGKPGDGSGSFTFVPEMHGRIYVRRNHADYPPSEGRPAFRHEDFMTVYREGDVVKADYVDNEDHVIRYIVKGTDQGIDFVSAADSKTLRYRMRYVLDGNNKMKLRFDIAPPGKPDQFTNYIEEELRRK